MASSSKATSLAPFSSADVSGSSSLPAFSLAPFLALLLALTATPVAAEWAAGKAALQKGDYATAVRELSQAVETHPDYAPAHYYLGVALKGAGRSGEALTRLRKAVELDPAQPAYGLGLARTFVAVERWEDALSTLGSYDLATLDPRLEGDFADSLAAAASKSDPGTALPVLRRAVEQKPASAGLWLALGSRARAAGHGEEALAAFERATEMNTGDVTAPRQAMSTALALAAARQGAAADPWLARAAEASAQLAGRDPSIANRLLAAEAHFNAGLTKEAGAHYEAVLANDPKSPEALVGRGRILLEEEDAEGALAALDRAAAASKEADLSTRIQRLRGYTLHKLERYAAAAAAYSQAGDGDKAAEMEEYGELADQNDAIEKKRRECQAKRADIEQKKADQKDLFPPAEWAQIERQMELALAECKPYLDDAT